MNQGNFVDNLRSAYPKFVLGFFSCLIFKNQQLISSKEN